MQVSKTIRRSPPGMNLGTLTENIDSISFSTWSMLPLPIASNLGTTLCILTDFLPFSACEAGSALAGFFPSIYEPTDVPVEWPVKAVAEKRSISECIDSSVTPPFLRDVAQNLSRSSFDSSFGRCFLIVFVMMSDTFEFLLLCWLGKATLLSRVIATRPEEPVETQQQQQNVKSTEKVVNTDNVEQVEAISEAQTIEQPDQSAKKPLPAMGPSPRI